MYMAGSFFKHVYLKKWIFLMWPAVFEVYCQMAGRVQNKYQALYNTPCQCRISKADRLITLFFQLSPQEDT